MGKKHRPKRKQAVQCPSFECPVCPVCGYADKLVEEGGDEPLYECTRCWVRFMLEDSRVEIEDDDDDAEANINMAACKPPVKLVCAICMGQGCAACGKKKKPGKDYQAEPAFGDCEELSDAPAK